MNYPTTHFNTLPVVITGPGTYRMRNGSLAKIHEVKPFVARGVDGPTRLQVTAFEAKGMAQMMFRGKLTFRGYDCWHVCGRRFPLKESQLDILEKVEEL